MKVEKPDAEVVFDFTHDENGQRAVKYANGQLVEGYEWLDLNQLAGFHDGDVGYRFSYDEDAHTPNAMQDEYGGMATLHYDQVGSLRVVAAESGNVIKEILYDPFGGILNDSNPDLHIPIGFAGGLHDRDLGFVRFSWRDYDTYTGRWAAPDPMGDAGGDPDWYGYCLNDPVNGIDPNGLLGFLIPFMTGMAGATALGSAGSYVAAKAADWFGGKTDKNYGKDKPTATEGVHNAMDKVININSGIVGAAGAASGAAALPRVAGAVLQHPDKIAAGSKGAYDFISSFALEGPPEPSLPGYVGIGMSEAYKWYKRNKGK